MNVIDQLIEKCESKDFGQLLVQLKSPDINHLLQTEPVAIVVPIASVFQQCVTLFEDETDELMYECCRLLRNSCAADQIIQNQIVKHENIFDAINTILFDKKMSLRTHKMCWQFVANLSVQNVLTQCAVWSKCILPNLSKLNCVCDNQECTMIFYNLFISEILTLIEVKQIVEILLECIESHHDLQNNDFHQLFMEHLITKYRTIVAVYDRLKSTEKRIHLIYYILDYMKIVCHNLISTPLLKYICKEFKKKSDFVLKTTATDDILHPKEVVCLLEIIVQASSDERYSMILTSDTSLFINVGCLLRSIHEIGKCNDTNIFTPVRKLTQLAPNSNEDTSIERDISYQLKSMLIRTLANLAYKNRENQNLAREMEFLSTVLDSTGHDARNPLMKEWSILAIRNLCEGNMENQEIIRQLSKVGDSKSDALKEFNLDLGSLRINPNE